MNFPKLLRVTFFIEHFPLILLLILTLTLRLDYIRMLDNLGDPVKIAFPIVQSTREVFS